MDAKHNDTPTSLPALTSSMPPYNPQHIFTMNDSHSVRAATLDGAFVWHAHADTDELFYVVSGGPLSLEIANRETNNEADGYGAVEMQVGDAYLVPKGVRHRPNARARTGVLAISRSGTVNTGDAAATEEGRSRTVFVDERKKVEA